MEPKEIKVINIDPLLTSDENSEDEGYLLPISNDPSDVWVHKANLLLRGSVRRCILENYSNYSIGRLKDVIDEYIETGDMDSFLEILQFQVLANHVFMFPSDFTVEVLIPAVVKINTAVKTNFSPSDAHAFNINFLMLLSMLFKQLGFPDDFMETVMLPTCKKIAPKLENISDDEKEIEERIEGVLQDNDIQPEKEIEWPTIFQNREELVAKLLKLQPLFATAILAPQP